MTRHTLWRGNWTVLGILGMATFLFGSSVDGSMIVGTPVQLSDLVSSDGEVLVGDKLFRDFTYVPNGDMPTPDVINVVPIQDDDENFGIRFQGGFLDLPGGSSSEATITYSVWATDLNRPIIDVHLEGDPNMIGGPGVVTVTETFNPEPLAKLTIFDQQPNPPVPLALVDWLDFDHPYQHLFVQKNILALATGNAGVAQVTFIDQTFSQIPEPSTSVLLALPALLLGAMLLRHRFDAPLRQLHH